MEVFTILLIFKVSLQKENGLIYQETNTRPKSVSRFELLLLCTVLPRSFPQDENVKTGTLYLLDHICHCNIRL